MTQLEQTVIIISHKITIKKKITFLEFPDGPAVRTLHFHCRGHNRFCPWSGTKIQQATQEKKRVGEWGGIALKKNKGQNL